jgi:hypothetical protein
MKKVLILAYDFPPYNSVGSQRPFSWYKYFKDQGLYPIIITRNWDNIEYGKNEAYTLATVKELKTEIGENGSIYFVPYKPNFRDKLLNRKGTLYVIFRKLLTLFLRLGQYMFFSLDNRNGIYHQAEEIIKKNNDITCIIATGEPFILFKYAHLLSKKYKIPWHADYRDDWIHNHTANLKGNITTYLLKVERFFEKKYLSNVYSLSSVSEVLVKDIQSRTGISNSHTIENGVDLNVLNSIRFSKNKKFTITYTGILYDLPYMEIVFKGFQSFLLKIENKKDISFKFIGINSHYNQAVKLAFELGALYPDQVEIIDRVPVEEAIRYQMESTILLNLIAGDPSKGLVGAKCYSYAATKKPILSVSLINNKDTFFFKGRNIHTIVTNEREFEEYLSEKFEEFKSGVSMLTDITDEETFRLSREYNANKLVNLIIKNEYI